ncbi:Cardiolipin synthetase [Minicystis rosea]|nr:Cardiolipin synthetase [Minicystis rosea]
MLATALTIAEIVITLTLIPWIALEKRPPVATLAWILFVFALPVAGPIVYYLLGHRRVKRSHFKRLRARFGLRAARDRLHQKPTVSERDSVCFEARQLMTLATEVSASAPSSALSIRILEDGDATFAAIEEAIRAARHHVHLEYYIYEPDRIGTRLRDLLVERARAGVEVRLLVDGVGGYHLTRSFLAPLRAAGAQVAFFGRVRAFRFRARLVNFRTHRKIVVVDGDIGFTGGINVTDDQCASANGPRAYRDTHLRFDGDAVRWLQLVFLEDWSYATGSAPVDDAYFPECRVDGPHAVQILASGPDEPWQAIQKLYFSAIAGARDRVWVTTPYFVPDEAVLTALLTAALRGVDVRVLVPRRSDSRIVTAAARSFFDELLHAGVKVYEYTPRMLHAKTLVVDDIFAAVGSANMDGRSFRLNYEVTAALYGPDACRMLAEIYERDLTHARRVTRGELANDKLPRRIMEAATRLLAPLL